MNQLDMKNGIKKAVLAVAISSLFACQSDGGSEGGSVDMRNLPQSGVEVWPVIDSPVKKDSKIEKRIAEILSTMTVEQKLAQMIQPEIRDITVEDMRKYGFGSYLNGGGSFPNANKHSTPQDWIKLAEDMYQASIDDSIDGSTIPTMWGTDAVHGHNNVIGATLFPHNIGLGAANNPNLIEEIAAVTAKEVMATGIDWVFAPTVAVVRDDRWGRTYEGYSEDPEIVRQYSASIVKGLQGVGDDFLSQYRVISTVKHFIGDGGTIDGDDQGNNIATERELFDIHAQGYVGGLGAGSQTVMASFNSWHGVKNHGNKYLLTDVLKDRMGFDGFVVGDWNGHGQIKGCSNEKCAQAINAGLDVFMAPTPSWKPLYYNTLEQIKSGEIAMSRIDDAVTRILRVKMRAGLFDKPSPAKRPLAGKLELIGAPDHREVARRAVRESLVLLKNNQGILPLSPKANILVTGDGADNIGKQSGGWTITWQGTGNTNEDFPGGTSIYDGIKQAVEAAGGQVQLSVNGDYQTIPEVAVVVFGEDPYAEGNGDLSNLDYQRGNKKDLALLKKLQTQGIKTVSVFISGRPMWVNAELNASDAFVAAWLPGSEGVGVADVLIAKANGKKNHDFKGKLSFSWPNSATQSVVNRFDNEKPLLPYGFGLRYGDKSILSNNLDETVAVEDESLENLDIFAGNLKAPWNMSIEDTSGATSVQSAVVENAAMYLRTIDKVVQEDARWVKFNGKQEGRLRIGSNFTEDLRAYADVNAALMMTVNIESKPKGDVNLSFACETNCSSFVNIKGALEAMPIDTWQTIGVDLACFNLTGDDMAKVFAPFILSSKDELSIKFADIKLMPDGAKSATVKCN